MIHKIPRAELDHILNTPADTPSPPLLFLPLETLEPWFKHESFFNRNVLNTFHGKVAPHSIDGRLYSRLHDLIDAFATWNYPNTTRLLQYYWKRGYVYLDRDLR